MVALNTYMYMYMGIHIRCVESTLHTPVYMYMYVHVCIHMSSGHQNSSFTLTVRDLLRTYIVMKMYTVEPL